MNMKVVSNNIVSIKSQLAYDKADNIIVEKQDIGKYSLNDSKRINFKGGILKFLGLKPKINPKTFAPVCKVKTGPFVASRQSVELSNKFCKNNYLSENDKIIDGYRDGGSGVMFDKFSNPLKLRREIITIDRKYDEYLNNVISYAKSETYNMSEKKKANFIFNLVQSISGNPVKGEKAASILGKKGCGQEVLLGKIFEHECATCRHKGLMFKILGDEVGLKARVVRGLSFDLSGYGPHQWNEVLFSDGSTLIFDTQNDKIFSPRSKVAKLYADVNGDYIYG